MTAKIQDFFLSCRECILENPRRFYGSFSLGPFKNSQSLTVANALRRTLLAELSGIAITHVEIEGVPHEYSTLSGTRESVLDLLLNFKQIVFKHTSPLKKPVFGYLSVRGPGIVRASDLKLPPTIRCVDPDQYIATLNEDGTLRLKFRISDYKNAQKNTENPENFLNVSRFKSLRNVRFRNFERFQAATKFQKFKTLTKKFSDPVFAYTGNISEKARFRRDSFQNQKNIRAFEAKKTHSFALTPAKTNALWVDPSFNPILKVNYGIETIEPIQKNIPNQIVFLELWTDGSIHPRKAFYEALLYLKTMFDKFDRMRFLNYGFTNAVLESEKTNSKYLKTFEYDFQFYDFLEKNKKKIHTTEPLFLPEEIEGVEKNYAIDLTNKSHQTWNTVPLGTLRFPNRIAKILEKNEFFVVHDLLKVTPKELKTLPGIGDFCVSVIQKRLEKFGLKLGSEKSKD